MAIVIGQEVDWALAVVLIGGFTVAAALTLITGVAVCGTIRLCGKDRS